MVDKRSYVYTESDECKGCNKCISKCPVGANEAFFEADLAKVFIKEGFCISCGECMAICDHNARFYFDDTEDFFGAIENGEKISVVIAPAARFNFPDVGKVISYLKSIGVNGVYDVSFGADICTWAHIKTIKDTRPKTMIAQPCPVVVSYVEKFKPSLIQYLSPIQSPVICLGTYLKKYLSITDKIMFLTPCVGKKRECNNPDTDYVLDYNVTFEKFMQHTKKQGIDFTNYESKTFDNMDGGIGFTFSRPGGLSENIKFNLGEDIWIKQVEGIENIEKYFVEYVEDINSGKPVPMIVDALNCIDGCNLGTGTSKSARHNEIDYVTNQNKKKITKNNTEQLIKYFDDNFNISDFIRKYHDRSSEYEKKHDIDIEQAFLALGKVTEEDRNINCFCCGYGNCHDFAYDLATGHNDKNNCRHYLLNKFKKLSLTDDLTSLSNRNCYNDQVKEYQIQPPEFLGIVVIDINGLKEANDVHGHNFGDELIITCASMLKTIFNNKAYRVGGDEFVVLFDTDEALFDKDVKKFRRLLGSEKSVSLSVGTSKCYASDNFDEKFHEADTAMYSEKDEHYRQLGIKDRRRIK